MVAIIENNRQALEEICRRYSVRRLELFGSAAGPNFDADSSDLDFLVEFLPLEEGEHAEAYFGLREDLENLFSCPVDLVMTRAIRNRYFLESINASRIPLYAA